VRPAARYVPQLDGLRGIAIFGVLLFHAERFALGWTGIVLFFVLSGFLITGILLDGRRKAAYFRNFYARRALRIFPAYYLVLGLTWWVKRDFTVSGLDVVIDAPALEWAWYLVYLQNYWLGVHWFSTPLARLLNFTWTLAVEEQFYLIWPLLVYFLSARALLTLCGVLVLSAPLARAGMLWATGNPMLTLAALPSHLDSLAVGAAISLMWSDERLRDFVSRRAAALLLLGAGVPLAILVGWHGVDAYAVTNNWMRLPGNAMFVSLLSLTFGAVLVLSLSGASWWSAALRWAPLSYLGKISYGVYLYHTLVYFLVLGAYRIWVFFPLPGMRIDPWHKALIIVCQIGTTVLLAAASYRYLERPLLALKERFR
jgi:peptidoglycan/LPS O-acetylase OafA/YrhL